MEWFILPDGRKCLPEGTILKFEYQGGCYRILGAPVGYGGAGVIYPAVRVIRNNGQWEPENMWVALKECYPQSTDGMLRRDEKGAVICASEQDAYTKEYYDYAKAMMRREKEVTGQIFNRGFRLTPIWDIVEQEEISLDGERFYPADNQYGIMERLDEKGTSLGRILEKQVGGCLTAYQSICVIEKILHAIAEVHKEGYLHGDIQANNIFLKGGKAERKRSAEQEENALYEDSVASLIDFGSARPFLGDGATAMITDRKLYTTNGYRAPECVTGNDGTLRLTRAADLYSVGYLLLRMMTGKNMDSKALQLVVNGKYLYARQAKKIGCPTACIDAVNRILQRALQERPEDRYQRTEEMLEEIGRLKRALAPEKSKIASTDYEAFISYAHEEKSIRAAEQIQKMLERYKIPGTVQKMSGRKKIHRIFRDREELACGSDLEAHLKEALEHSEYLIVLLSPKVPESQWVHREIELFLKNHDRNHVLTVLTDGELQDVYPEILRQEEKVEMGQIRMRPVEGLAADVRCEDARELKRKLKTEIYRLLAPILGCSFDELRQRQKEYVFHRTVGAMSVGMLVFGTAAGYMGWQAYQIRENYRETLRRQSRYLAQVSSELLEAGDRQKAVQVALEALPENSADDSRPLVPEAEAALANAVYAYQGVWSANTYRSSDFLMEMDSSASYLERISPEDGYFLAMDETDTIYIWDVKERILKCKWNTEFREALQVPAAEIITCDFLDEDTVLLVTPDSILHMSVEEQCMEGAYPLEGLKEPYLPAFMDCAFSENREYLAVYNDNWSVDSGLCVYRTEDGALVCEEKTGEFRTELMSGNGELTGVRLSPDGRYAALSFYIPYNRESTVRGVVLAADLQKGTCVPLTDEKYGIREMCFTGENQLLTFGYLSEEENYFMVEAVEIDAAASCYDFEKMELCWQTELSVGLDQYGYYGVETDDENETMLLWCGQETARLDRNTGVILERKNCDRKISGVQRNTNGGYLIGLEDGTICLFTDRIYREFGTNVTFQTSRFLDDGEQYSYLISNEGAIACLKATVDENRKIVEMPYSISGVWRFDDYPVYAVYKQNDETHTMRFFSSEDDTELFEMETEGYVEDGLVLADGRTFCYLEYVGFREMQLTWYDMAAQEVTRQQTLEYSESNIQLLKNSRGEELAVGYDEQQVQLLDLKTGEWLAEEILLAEAAADIQAEAVDIQAEQDADISEEARITQVYMSKDGRYVVVTENYEPFSDEGQAALQLYDRETHAWVKLPKEIRELRMMASYTELVFMAEEKNLAAVFEAGRLQLVLIDLEKQEILQEIPFNGTEKRQVQFLSDDTALLLWGDDSYLKLWNISEGSLKMEDRQKMYNVRSIEVYEDNGFIEIWGIDEASREIYDGSMWRLWLYLLEEDGTFYPYVGLWNGFFEPHSDRIGEDGWLDDNLRWYELYSLDELLEMGRDVVDGYTLGEADRVKYFMAE